MSVLVKGMEMPKSCSDCFYEYETLKGETCCAICNGSISNDESFSKRIPSCPLVEIPPHGRLIDADAYHKEIKERYQSASEWYHEAETDDILARAESAMITFTECSLTLQKMPTVIEAEEET